MSRTVFVNASAPDNNSNDESRVIIASPDVTDMKQAVDDHFNKSLSNAMTAFASTGGQLTRQWPDRNLPKEFSKPPASAKSKTSSNTPVSHSRDGSTDSSGRYTLSPPAASPLVSHSRTHSSPAIISNVQQGAFLPGSQPASLSSVQHQRYRSFDTTTSDMGNPFQSAVTASDSYGQQLPSLQCEKTSKSLGDLATTGVGMDFGFHSGPMQLAETRKSSCDSSAAWQEFSSGPTMQKPASHFMRHPRSLQLSGPSAVPSGGVQRQILKRQQQQHQQQQQQQQQQQHCQYQHQPSHVRHQAVASGGPSFNPVVQELNLERQRMYERNAQLRQQGLLDPLPPAHSLAPRNHFQHGFADSTTFQYPVSAAPRTLQNPQFSTQMSMPGSIHVRQASSDSGLGMHPNSGGYSYPYVENPSEMDLNFANISLDPSTLMELDPTLASGPLDIGPDDLDQYLNQ